MKYLTRKLSMTLIALLIVAVDREAQADQKQECARAYQKTQALRKQGKLLDARKEAMACGESTCSIYVTTECRQWLSEIDRILPTIVLTARDADGIDTTAVRVILDGQRIAERLDNQAVLLDPGEHLVRFEMLGGEAIEQTVTVQSGDKDRKVTALFQKRAPIVVSPIAAPPAIVRAAPEALAPQPHVGVGSGGQRIATYVVGGVGVAGLVFGSVTGGLMLSKKSVVDAKCNDVGICTDREGVDAANHARTLANLSTVGWTIALAGVGTATVLFLTDPSRNRSSTKRGTTGSRQLASTLSASVGPTGTRGIAIQIGGAW